MTRMAILTPMYKYDRLPEPAEPLEDDVIVEEDMIRLTILFYYFFYVSRKNRFQDTEHFVGMHTHACVRGLPNAITDQ